MSGKWIMRIRRNTPLGIAAGGFAIAAVALAWSFVQLAPPSQHVIPGEPELSADEQPEQTSSGESSEAIGTATTGEPRILIPKIGVVMPIVEGKDERSLLQGAWRSPYGSTPDATGNTILFGHRWYHKPPHPETFYDLDKLAAGDTVQVEWKGSIYTYRVTETLVVSPTDVWVLKQTQSPILTLITCTPLYTTESRLVVRGELVAPEN